jgi:hypothetical protein
MNPDLDTPTTTTVRRELYPPAADDTTRAAYRECLLAWARVNAIPTDKASAERPITVNLTTRTVRYWRRFQPGDNLRPGEHPQDLCRTQWREDVAPLVAEPVGILIGEDFCGHVHRPDTTTMRCWVDVDPTGRHPGPHTDRMHNTTWPNPHPGDQVYRRGRPDVTGLTPTAQHTAILAAFTERAGRPGSLDDWQVARDLEGLAGRFRILDRHQPVERTKHPDQPHFCAACIDRPDYPGRTAADWPCPDYRDAASGLVTGLETPNAT